VMPFDSSTFGLPGFLTMGLPRLGMKTFPLGLGRVLVLTLVGRANSARCGTASAFGT
jgi:hypothetical protein